jgi:hypothetical protein
MVTSLFQVVRYMGCAPVDSWLDLRGNEPGGVFCPVNRWGRFRKVKGCEALKAMTTEAARLILAEHSAQAGITKRITWHDFRRTLIRNLIRQDIGIAQRTACSHPYGSDYRISICRCQAN